MTFAATGLTSVTSASITPTAFGAAAAIAITTEPSVAVSGSAFTNQPVVRIVDAAGNTVTSSSAVVTVSKATGTGTLSGTLTATASSGVATFTDLVITGSGAHTLTFAATGLTSVTSASITPTAADTTAPTVTFLPAASATDVAITSTPTITFNEAIRKAADNSAVINSSVGDLITFKKDNASGIGVAFTATINTEKTVITITPTASLENSQVYYLAIGASVEDAADNAITASNASFTTIAAGPADADPIAGDFDISGLTATADGTAKTVTITPKAGKSAGAITRKYAGSTTAPSAAGTYAVTFDVAAAAGYNAVIGLSAGNLVISAAVASAATSSGDGGAAAAAAAKAAADKAAADKAAADKLAAADKAAADKVAADKVAAEKIAAEKAAVEKAETQARAAAEAVVKAEEAKVAAAVVKAAAVTVKPVVSKSGTKLTLDLPDKYYGKIVTVFVGTTVKGKTTYKKLDFFVLDKEDGTANITSKVKLVKGQVIRVNVGSTVVKSVKI